MSAAEIAGLLGGIAGLITAVGGILAGIVKIRQERAETDWKIREGKRDARRLAAEESQSAIKGIAAANAELRKHLSAQSQEHQRQLDAQHQQHQREQKELSQRITSQGSQIADLTTRMTDIQRRHQAAIDHIVDRERAIVVSWGKRPESVPVVPKDLVPELLEADPSLRLISHEKPSRPPPDRRIRDPTD